MDAMHNQVLVAAFYDELEKISADLQGDPLTAFNAMFKGAKAHSLEELLKQASALDALKRFMSEGKTAAGPITERQVDKAYRNMEEGATAGQRLRAGFSMLGGATTGAGLGAGLGGLGGMAANALAGRRVVDPRNSATLLGGIGGGLGLGLGSLVGGNHGQSDIAMGHKLEKLVALENALDEQQQLGKQASADLHKVASAYADVLAGEMTEEAFVAMCKEGGLLDAAKRFFMGGTNAAGIPVKGLLRNLGGESSYLPTMAENLAHGAREGGRVLRGAGQELAGHAQTAAGKVKDFVAGGTQNGIPMQSLGQQLTAGNPFHGMMGSLRQNVPEMMRPLPGALQKAGPTGTQLMPAVGRLA